MSSTVLTPPQSARQSGRGAGRGLAILTTLLVLLSGLFLPAPPAQAATLGVGYGNHDVWIGSFSSHGRQAYCMDLMALPPWGTTQHPELKTTLGSLSAGQLAQLNYVLAVWGESLDPNVTAAVQLFVWDVADHGNYVNRGGDGHFITRVPSGQQATVLANLSVMRSEATQNAVPNPSVSVSISMSDQYAGQLTVTTNPASLAGQVTLTNATFANGSTAAK